MQVPTGSAHDAIDHASGSVQPDIGYTASKSNRDVGSRRTADGRTERVATTGLDLHHLSTKGSAGQPESCSRDCGDAGTVDCGRESA